MRSYAYFIPSGLKTFFKAVTTIPRAAVIGVVVVLAAIVGTQGLAVGPSQSRSMTPALPTGAAMESQSMLSSIPLSFDLINALSVLERHHASYPETQVGPLSFPEGAIDVPWTLVAMGPSENRQMNYANTRITGPAGNTFSTPRRNDVPEVLSASTRQPAATPASLRATVPANGIMANGNWRSVVLFDTAGAELSTPAATALDNISNGLRGTGARIQLLAYGGSTAERSHSARRLALRRALAVRNHLMNNGVDAEQIAVRALGGATDGGPSSRVDVIIPSN